MFYEASYLVDSRDADPQGLCRPSALLGYLQETATRAAIALQVSREEMLVRYHAFWMMARIWYRLDSPLRWDQQVTVRTWHRGDKGVSMYRDFDLLQDGRQVGEAVSVWVLADADTRGLMRLGRAVELEGTDGGALCKERTLGKLRIPCPLEPVHTRQIYYSDADVNGHMNNVRYADLACDALELETLGRGSFVSQLQIGYLAECLPGETLTLSRGAQEGTRYVEGRGPEGKPRFDAMLSLTEE